MKNHLKLGKHFTQLLIASSLFIMVFTACKQEEEKVEPLPLSATVGTETNYTVIDLNTLKLPGKIEIATGKVSAHGHVWSTTERTPTLENSTTFSDLGELLSSKSYETELTNAGGGKLFHYRAYLKDSKNVVKYGAVKEASAAWRPQTNFAGGNRRDGAIFAIGSSIFVGLGNSHFDQPLPPSLADLWEYIPQESRWTKRANFPGLPREEPYFFVINDKAYIGGGVAPVGNNPVAQKDLWEFDPALNQWKQKTGLDQTSSNFTATSFSIGNKGYVAINDKLYQYDAEKDSWGGLGQIGIPKNYASSFVINGKGYMVGGQGFPDNALTEYDPTTNTWDNKAKFPGASTSARGEMVAFVLNGKAYVGTGTSNLQTFTPSLQQFWAYDPTNNTWTEAPSMPYLRQGSFAASNGIRAFVGMGNDLNDWWEFLP